MVLSQELGNKSLCSRLRHVYSQTLWNTQVWADREFHYGSTSTPMHTAQICAFNLNRIGIPCLPKPVYSTGFGSQYGTRRATVGREPHAGFIVAQIADLYRVRLHHPAIADTLHVDARRPTIHCSTSPLAPLRALRSVLLQLPYAAD